MTMWTAEKRRRNPETGRLYWAYLDEVSADNAREAREQVRKDGNRSADDMRDIRVKRQ
ncbi:MAG: hypothetical protein FD189_1090 [Elusimicrobia bacterium]|nr:MAG: hypothetical protein FD189_1090 [Elusimicrobiota bacterium]